MAEVIPSKDEIIHAESLALGSSAENLVDAGATIPQNAGDVIVVCPSGDSLHWAPSVTPTSALGRPRSRSSNNPGPPWTHPAHLQQDCPTHLRRWQ